MIKFDIKIKMMKLKKKNQFKKGFKTKLIEIKTLRIKYDTKTK